MCLKILRVVVVDGVVLGDELIDKTVRVAFEAIGIAAALAVVRHVVGCRNLDKRVRWGGEQVRCRDTVEVVGGQSRVVESRSIGR